MDFAINAGKYHTLFCQNVGFYCMNTDSMFPVNILHIFRTLSTFPALK